MASMAEILGKLHNEHQLFSIDDLNISHEKDITNYLEDFPELLGFYSLYKKEFNNTVQNKPNQDCARSKDLPFIGNDTMKKKKAKFIYYFEGSLSQENKLSITVLAHLFTTDDIKIIDKFFGQKGWWTEANFKRIKDKLKITKSIAEQSYIADAVRFKDNEKNKNLIEEEIRLLKPELVICVGSKALEMVGMKYYDLPTKFHHVKFPKYHNDDNIYIKLNEIVNNYLKY
jgi:hypothetical protein